jgi:hypothetical protein
MPACLRRPPLGRPRTQPTTPPPAGRGGRENIFERLAWGYDRLVRRNPSTVVVLAGKTSEPVLAAVERSMNVVLVRPADDADGGDGVAVAAAALRRAAGISAPYVLVAADPLAAVAAEWSAMWDLSQETHGSERFELRAAEALAAWRANQFELPDYYLVLAAETGPTASAEDQRPDFYLGPLRSVRPHRVVVAAAAEPAEQAAAARSELGSLRAGRWWPSLEEVFRTVRGFYPGALAESPDAGRATLLT